eukprot:361100-Chlamydomonas_euryale.AAC.13
MAPPCGVPTCVRSVARPRHRRSPRLLSTRTCFLRSCRASLVSGVSGAGGSSTGGRLPPLLLAIWAAASAERIGMPPGALLRSGGTAMPLPPGRFAAAARCAARMLWFSSSVPPGVTALAAWRSAATATPSLPKNSSKRDGAMGPT